MANIEQAELATQHQHLVRDVRSLVEKYCAIFGWNVPDIDQAHADKLILDDMRKALDGVEQEERDAFPLARRQV
jgi:hypothetical protein